MYKHRLINACTDTETQTDTWTYKQTHKGRQTHKHTHMHLNSKFRTGAVSLGAEKLDEEKQEVF